MLCDAHVRFRIVQHHQITVLRKGKKSKAEPESASWEFPNTRLHSATKFWKIWQDRATV